MSETFTKGMARNIYFGGSVFFILLFLALTYHTEKTLPERTNEAAMSAAVVRGKLVWEQNNCVGCHTLLGEGAYFAPEEAACPRPLPKAWPGTSISAGVCSSSCCSWP